MTTDSQIRSKTAERAYYYYEQREKLGLPGSEQDDWAKAEAEIAAALQKHSKSSSVPVTEIKGIGPRVASELKQAGVTTCDQLAAWELSDFGEKLPRLTARARSGQWIEQARDLA